MRSNASDGLFADSPETSMHGLSGISPLKRLQERLKAYFSSAIERPQVVITQPSGVSSLQSLREDLKLSRLASSINRTLVFIPISTMQRLVNDNVANILREESMVEAQSIPLIAS
ncbi:hypothetical protein BDW59DRAFT_147409 [Aspergillus cavernicola]|uniref:Uncharacterized protein n=1 Tax=Aspergillus cavernicola TaxID=176166 RepID=A0ABR4I9P4_9EURO